MITILIFVITLILLISAYIVFRIHDLKTTAVSLEVFRNSPGKTNILVIYPHPDDETMASGGLINLISKRTDFELHVVTVTKGEKGKELLDLPDKELAQIRTQEFFDAVSILEVKNAEAWDFPDGEINENKIDLKNRVLEYIERNKISTIVTYERTGIYGHKDHVALSKIIHEISRENRNIKVFYLTIPAKLEKLYNFPKHIKGLSLTKNTLCEKPEIRILKINTYFKQLKAAKAYKSQNLNHGIPLWLNFLIQPFEYFTTVYEGATKY